MVLRVHGRERIVTVWDAPAWLRRGGRGRALPGRVLLILVPGLQLQPWYGLTTALDLAPREAVQASDGRYHIEVHIEEVQEVGLAHYHGRRGHGLRRWPCLLCLGQMILKFLATGVLPVPLPKLPWAWSEREHTGGQVRRRLMEACCARISRVKVDRPIRQKLVKVA